MPTGVVRPTFLIAGAARSGTTALAAALARHPEVFVTDPKEIHFLDHVDRPVRYTGPGDDLSINRCLVTDPAAYHALYAAAADHPARGEGSVSTLYHPDRTIPAIEAHADGEVKVLAILREPAARAHSAFRYLRGRGFETCTRFAQALALEEQRRSDGWHHIWHLRAMSRYQEQVPAFAAAFGDRFKVVIHEEYRRDGQRHLADICSFLGVDPDVALDPDRSVNGGGEPRSRVLARAMNLLRSSETTRRVVRGATPLALREAVRLGNLRPAAADPDEIRALAADFVDDVACVEALLGRPIPDWHLS